MSTYKGIKGFTVQSLATDPKTTGVAAGAWSSGGNLNTARSQAEGAGSQTAAIACGGLNPGLVPADGYAITESYDGTSWSEVADLPAARYEHEVTGTQTSAITAGGYPNITPTESWNGTAWSETAEINTGRASGAAAGATNQAALLFLGQHPMKVNTELYNGTCWSEVADLTLGRINAFGTGSSTAAICAGGGRPPGVYTGETEIWNGTAWTEVADLNTDRFNGGAAGISTAAIVYAGTTGSVSALAESWDGTSWTEVGDMATARSEIGGVVGTSASNSLALAIGGGPPYTAATEEWTAATITDTIINEGQVYFNTATELLKFTKNVLGTGAWASGANINSARSEFGGGAGTQSAFLIFGGTPAPLTQLTESYDGSTWTEVADLNSSRYYATGFGTQTSAICATGNPGTTVNVESWDGTCWAETANVNSGRWGAGSSKSSPSTSALIAGGKTTADVGLSESWNGTAWSEEADLNTARRQVGSCGASQTAVLIMSGMPSPKLVVEEWNGSAWTEVADVGATRYGGGGAGTTTSALFIGGAPGSKANESWNGSAWTEVGDLALYHDVAASGGTGVIGIVAGGRGEVPISTATEEWTVPQTATNVTVDTA